MTQDEFQNKPEAQRLKAALFKKRIKNGSGVYGGLAGRIQDARDAFVDLSFSFPTTDESVARPLRPTWYEAGCAAVAVASWIGAWVLG